MLLRPEQFRRDFTPEPGIAAVPDIERRWGIIWMPRSRSRRSSPYGFPVQSGKTPEVSPPSRIRAGRMMDRPLSVRRPAVQAEARA